MARAPNDDAMEEATRSDADPPTRLVDATSGVEVDHRVEAEQREATEEPSQLQGTMVVTAPGEHLHDDGFGDASGPSPSIRSATRRWTALPVARRYSHPGGGVGEDHTASIGAASSGTRRWLRCHAWPTLLHGDMG